MAYVNIGVTNSDLADYRGAIANYTKTIELDLKFAMAYFNRVVAKLHLNQMDSGCLDLSKASELGFSQAYDAIRDLCK
jgi:hypothetical protein